MVILICGLTLWAGVHLMPAVLPSNKKALLDKLGEKRYKLLFTLLIFTSIALIVVGYRNTQPQFLYHFSFAKHPAYLMILVAFALMAAANIPSHIKNLVRHPQLVGVFIWASAHILLNGDTRALMLFGTLAIWCVLAMLFINRRDGDWQRPPVTHWKGDVIVIVATLVVVPIVMLIHGWLGVPLMH